MADNHLGSTEGLEWSFAICVVRNIVQNFTKGGSTSNL